MCVGQGRRQEIASISHLLIVVLSSPRYREPFTAIYGLDDSLDDSLIRRRETLISNLHCLVGIFGRRKDYGSQPRQKIRRQFVVVYNLVLAEPCCCFGSIRDMGRGFVLHRQQPVLHKTLLGLSSDRIISFASGVDTTRGKSYRGYKSSLD